MMRGRYSNIPWPWPACHPPSLPSYSKLHNSFSYKYNSRVAHSDVAVLVGGDEIGFHKPVPHLPTSSSSPPCCSCRTTCCSTREA